ncbi:MAG: ABC-2 family transporter protein [Planctomycetes bacterium]|nr:ABC-2 family transporter protein [Planctomycetota bacterium]MBI3848513.1 ABC-2 family transporter protein [Planctomycetota bacterium]
MSPSLFFQIVSVEARKRMSYRVDFWINAVVGFFVQFGIAWFLWTAVYRESGAATIGGYTVNGMVLYFAAAQLLGRIARGLEMDGAISQDVYDGQLSRYLVYPAGFFRFKYAQQLGAMLPIAIQLVLCGAWVPLFIALPSDVHVTLATVAGALVAVLAANFLNFLATIPIQAVSFWADNVWSLMIAYRFLSALLGGQMVPLTVFPDWAKPVLTVLPFRFLYAFPVDTLLGRVSLLAWAGDMAILFAWCAVFGLLARVVWRRASLVYTGVGM